MADNATLPATGAVIAADDISSALYQRIKMIIGADGTNDGDVCDGNPLPVRGAITNPTANFTRPSDTTAYAANDLVANSTTAGSVTAMALAVARVSGGSAMIRKAKLHKSGTVLTNAVFRAHFFRAQPGTITNGDNGAFSVSGVADYLGAIDFTLGQAFTDGSAGFGTMNVGSDLNLKLSGTANVYVLLQAMAAYTPISAEVFTLTLEVLPN